MVATQVSRTLRISLDGNLSCTILFSFADDFRIRPGASCNLTAFVFRISILCTCVPSGIFLSIIQLPSASSTSMPATMLCPTFMAVVATAHEAVGHQPAPEGAEPTESGEPRVTQVMRAGYRWHGTVVRPAMVMVEG